MDIVRGGSVRLYAYNTDGYYLFACASEVSLTEDTEVLSTTSPASGKFRTFKTRLSDWKLSLKGVLFLRSQTETRWVALDLFTDAIRKNGLAIKMVFTDESGYEKTMTGNVFIPSKSINASASMMAKFDIQMQGSGSYTLT